MGRLVRGSRVLALVLVATVPACASAPPAEEPRASLLVSVGEPTESTAVLWVRGTSTGPVTVRYETGGSAPLQRLHVEVNREQDLTGKVLLTGLRPGTEHRYVVSQGGEEVQGRFHTAPLADTVAPVRFSWSGDLGSRDRCRHIAEGYPIFRALRDTPGHLFLFVGDTIYADHRCRGADRVPGYDFVAKTLNGFRAKHRYNRSDPAAQEFARTRAVYAIWDDHEVRNDFSGPDEPLMRLGRQAFLDYFPLLPPAADPTRLYRSFRWGQLLEVFILDTRQYRSPNSEADGPRKSMLGLPQRRWLVESVSVSTAVWKVIVTSVPLSVPTGRGARDSWTGVGPNGRPDDNPTGFATERDDILGALHRRGVKNLVFLTTDVHHAEVLRHEPRPGWTIHELIAGPLSASLGSPRPVDATLNPKSLFGLGGIENFGDIAVDDRGLRIRIVDALGQERFSHTIAPSP